MTFETDKRIVIIVQRDKTKLRRNKTMTNSYENFLFDCYYGTVVADEDAELEREYTDAELSELRAEMNGDDF